MVAKHRNATVRGLTFCIAPEIITTAPTNEPGGPKKKVSKNGLTARLRRSGEMPRSEQDHSLQSATRRLFRKSFSDERSRPSLSTLEEQRPSLPPLNELRMASRGGGLRASAAANRASESSRSDGSTADPNAHSQSGPGALPKKSLGSTPPFLKLRRAKKPAESLFPLSHLPQKDKTPPAGSSSQSLSISSTPRPSSAQSSHVSRHGTERPEDSSQAHPATAAALCAPSGHRSRHSSPTRAAALRGRSSTLSSVGRNSADDHLLAPTARTSSSTGRKSFGDLFGLTRLRQNSEASRHGSTTPATPGSIGSKNNSLQLVRNSSISLPERREEESAAKYLVRIEEVLDRSVIAATLSKASDSFSAAVLRSYMRSFSFFGEPVDIAFRKLLMEATLPKETQHIDRCLQAFANRYHECNPGIYSSPDQAYFITFSILILHTDIFNKNNKYKMAKSDYVKNTGGQGIFDDILEYMYDNISYTPFIHVDDDLDLNNHRLETNKAKKRPLMQAASGLDPAKRAAREPLDPYGLIMDGQLDALRPNLKNTIQLDDPFSYLGTAHSLNMKDLQKTFFRTGILQIVSARSRPDAFMSEMTAINPKNALPGIVDIKVTKVGVLWRKDAKKRKARSPWQEWGAILTGAQLYLFRNVSWVKSLIHQYESHVKSGHDGIPIIFKPPLEEFKPDTLMPTHQAVALVDNTYKKHKHAFVYLRQNGLDEVFLADNEEEMNDWLAKLNYAAAFRTTGVRMRGVIGGNYDGQGSRGIRRLENSEGTRLVQTPTGPVSIARSRIDQKMVDDIQVARREVIKQKIEQANQRIGELQKHLDEQLRNGRNLHILTPIKPQTRDHILSAAARMEAQLRWRRTEIWREKCHRDILAKDLELDESGQCSSPPQRASQLGRQDTKSTQRSDSDRKAHSLPHLHSTQTPNLLEALDLDSPLDQSFHTPPQNATFLRPISQELSHLALDTASPREGSASSMGTSPVQSPQLTPEKLEDEGRVFRNDKRDQEADDVDAEERDFLRKAGLLDAKSERRSGKRANRIGSGDGVEQGPVADRERADKNKIRRSLHRTLRESAGQLSHHRSKRGRDLNGPGAQDDDAPESTLSRGVGSFVVHGKKASVIQLGSELQSMSQDEKNRAWKLKQQQEEEAEQQEHQERNERCSPTSHGGEEEEEDFHSAFGDSTEEHHVPCEHRESTASASTATARSFRELHRKYSSAQAARSTSMSARLFVHSDAESEATLSLSDGRRSPLPPIENETKEGGEEDDEDEGRGSRQELSTNDSTKERRPHVAHDGDHDEEASSDESVESDRPVR